MQCYDYNIFPFKRGKNENKLQSYRYRPISLLAIMSKLFARQIEVNINKEAAHNRAPLGI